MQALGPDPIPGPAIQDQVDLANAYNAQHGLSKSHLLQHQAEIEGPHAPSAAALAALEQARAAMKVLGLPRVGEEEEET